MVRHDDLARSALVRQHLPDLAAAWDQIANIRIRTQGTVAGNVLAGVPAYEGPALLCALDAQLLAREAVVPVSSLGAAIAGFVPFRNVVSTTRLPRPERGLTRRVIHDRCLRPALTVTFRLDHAEGQVMLARAILGGCRAWPVIRDLPARGMTLGDLTADAPALAAAGFDRLPLPTVSWQGTARYRGEVAIVLLRREAFISQAYSSIRILPSNRMASHLP
jgi:aerobic carbon-monoxide dehydrogenase medium subunit